MGVLADRREEKKSNWTLYLMLNCLVVCMGSFQFGYHIGVTNLPSSFIKDYFLQDKVDELRSGIAKYNEGKARYDEKYAAYTDGLPRYIDGEIRYAEGIAKVKMTKELLAKYEKENQTAYDIIYEKAAETNLNYTQEYGMMVEDFLKDARYKLNIANKTLTNAPRLLEEGKKNLNDGAAKIKDGTRKINYAQDVMWTIANCLFVLGGMIGAITSKPFLDRLGLKKSIIYHNAFALCGVALVVTSSFTPKTFPYTFVLIIASRLFSGVQGGMACTLVPNYLNEISPTNLRGATGVVSQLCITLGIAVSQLLGFRQLFGTANLWMYLLIFPAIPALICAVFLWIFFTESPASLIRNGDKDAAELALKKLRNSDEVDDELDEIKSLIKNQSDIMMSIKDLLFSKELRWPLLISMVIHLTQQLCGINAIFFYSTGIFGKAGIPMDSIQYCVFATGVINVMATLIAMPIIDTLGRKPLLVGPMIGMAINFVILTIFLNLQDLSVVFPYLCIACIGIFIILFAVGLGPIPFIYVAECFTSNARGSAMSIAVFINWLSNLLLTGIFVYMADFLGNYVFLVFTVIVILSLVFIILKAPETKNKSPDQILNLINSKKYRYDQVRATSSEVTSITRF